MCIVPFFRRSSAAPLKPMNPCEPTKHHSVGRNTFINENHIRHKREPFYASEKGIGSWPRLSQIILPDTQMCKKTPSNPPQFWDNRKTEAGNSPITPSFWRISPVWSGLHGAAAQSVPTWFPLPGVPE